MAATRPDDYFDKARSVAATILFLCAAVSVLGAFLDWVTVQPPEVIPADQAPRLAAFTGMELDPVTCLPYSFCVGDGGIVVAAAAMVILAAVMLVLRARSSFAWLAFFASMVIGGIAIADFRGLDTVFYDEMNRIGDPSPGIGLILVAVGGLVGLVAAVAAVAATPSRPAD